MEDEAMKEATQISNAERVLIQPTYPKREPKTALLDVQERAAAFFQERLRGHEGREAREHLKLRGIDDETIVRFRIGYAPDSGFLLRDALRREFGEELLREAGLFSWKADTGDIYDKFRNRIMFPICDDQGTVIAFTGRTLLTDEKKCPKYLRSPETAIYSRSHVIFNLDKAKGAIAKLDYSILVKGQIDCISVYAAGFRNVIASLGTPFTEVQANLLRRFSKNIVVNFNPDTAEARAMEATIGLLVEEGFNVRVLTLEPELDTDSFILRHGKDAYAEALKHAQSYSKFWEPIKEDAKEHKESLLRAFDELSEQTPTQYECYLAMAFNAVFQGNMTLNLAAATYGVNPKHIQTLIRRGERSYWRPDPAEQVRS